jgi:hypothetical protein
LTSPLHVNKILPEQWRKNASQSWESALYEAETLHSDSMPEFAGSIWNTAHLWIMAQEFAATRPVLAAALLLILSEQDKLLLGKFPK